MEKKKLLVLFGSTYLILLLTALPFMAACAKPAPPTAPAPAKPITLALSVTWPELSTPAQRLFVPWMAEVEKHTGGRIKIEPFWSNTLTVPPDSWDATRAGTCDISSAATSINPGRIPLTEGLILIEPGAFPPRSSRVYWEVYKALPEVQAEFSGVKLLFFYTFTPNVLQTVKRPIRTVEDCTGLKVWSTSYISIMRLKAVGLTPVTTLSTEVYMGLETGLLDSVSMGLLAMPTFKLWDHIKYVTEVPVTGTPFWVIMNLDKYNSLPPDLRQMFDEVTGAYAADLFDRAVWDVCEEIKEEATKNYGIEFIKLSPEESARWAKLWASVTEEWVAEVEAKGLPGRKVLDEMERLFDVYAKF